MDLFWDRNLVFIVEVSGNSVFHKNVILFFFWYLNLVHKAGRFKSTYLKLSGSNLKEVSKTSPQKY